MANHTINMAVCPDLGTLAKHAAERWLRSKKLLGNLRPSVIYKLQYAVIEIRRCVTRAGKDIVGDWLAGLGQPDASENRGPD